MSTDIVMEHMELAEVGRDRDPGCDDPILPSHVIRVRIRGGHQFDLTGRAADVFLAALHDRCPGDSPPPDDSHGIPAQSRPRASKSSQGRRKRGA